MTRAQELSAIEKRLASGCNYLRPSVHLKLYLQAFILHLPCFFVTLLVYFFTGCSVKSKMDNNLITPENNMIVLFKTTQDRYTEAIRDYCATSRIEQPIIWLACGVNKCSHCPVDSRWLNILVLSLSSSPPTVMDSSLKRPIRGKRFGRLDQRFSALKLHVMCLLTQRGG